LWRIRLDVNVVPVPPPSAKDLKTLGAYQAGRLTAFLMSKPGKLDCNGAWWCDPQDYSGFWVKTPNTNSEIGTTNAWGTRSAWVLTGAEEHACAAYWRY
jgi:hypothetical protein